MTNFVVLLQTVKEEVPIEESEEEAEPKKEEKEPSDEDEVVEEPTEEKEKPKTKTIEKTVWDWELLNDNKPIWTRKYVKKFRKI